MGLQAKEYHIGKDAFIDPSADIKVTGIFFLGDRSRLGTNVKIRGNNVIFGDDLYHDGGLIVGGGGNNLFEFSNLVVGNRCVLHDNFINICGSVVIEDDVGLSNKVSILTHGFWMSVLEGYPTKFEKVEIRSGVIIGYGTTILPGVDIAKNIVVGANSVVTKPLVIEKSVYAGNPARFIKEIEEPTLEEKIEMLNEMLSMWKQSMEFRNQPTPIISVDYPYVSLSFDYDMLMFICDVDTRKISSNVENEVTDEFRDFMRRFGIRLYTDRPFKSLPMRYDK